MSCLYEATSSALRSRTQLADSAFACTLCAACIFFAAPELIIETVILAFCKDTAETGGQFCPDVLRQAIFTHQNHSRACCKRPAADDADGGAGGVGKIATQM